MFGSETIAKWTNSVKILFEKDSGPILITGADGVVAHRIVLRLLDAKYPHLIKVGLVDPLTATIPTAWEQASNVQVVRFDWADKTTYGPALEGMRSVFLSMPHLKEHQGPQLFQVFLSQARMAGVGHFVKLSFYHALLSEANGMKGMATARRQEDPFLHVPAVKMHRECDLQLLKLPQPLTYTILFCSHFMSNPFVYQAKSLTSKEHVFYGASGGHGVNYVSPNDCAEVACLALCRPKQDLFYRKGLTVTGPHAVTDQQVAETLGKHWKTSVKYQDESLEDFAAHVQDTDWGSALDVAYLEYPKALGMEEDAAHFASKDSLAACGHPAETFDQYLDHPETMTARELVQFAPAAPTPVM